MNRRAALPAVALSALLLCVSAAPGEETSAGSFGEKVTVTVVQVPVQVFADGDPVRGLTEADFEVYDEGQRRELSYFEVVDLTQTVDEAAAAGPRSEQAHRSLLVLFDLAFSDPRSLERARRGVAEMLDAQLHPADRVAIATYTPGGGAKMLVGFTADRELLGSALEFLGTLFRGSDRRALMLARTSLEHKQMARRLGRDELARSSAGLGPSAALALDGRLGPGREASGLAGIGSDGSVALDPTANQKYFQEASQLGESLIAEAEMREAIAATRDFTESMSELVTLLRDLDGQKHLLYLSRGFPNVVMETQIIAQLTESMFEAFRRSGWQVQAVDLRGQPDPFGGTTPELGAPSPDPPGPIAFKADSLLNMVKGTGGELYENFSNVALATRRILTKTSVTYVLSFSVADLPEDGRYRKLEVRLKGRDGYRIQHREGYYAPKPDAKKTDLERRLDEAERLLGDAEGGELEAAVQAYPLRPAGGMAPVPFFLEVAGPSLGRLGEAAKRTLRVRAFLLEGSGEIAGAFAHETVIDVEQAKAALLAHGVHFYGAVVAPPGEHRLRLAVEDVEGGRSWLGTVPFTVAGADEDTVLAPPVFVDLAGGWVVARYDSGSAGALYPFKLGERDVLPAVKPRLATGDTRAVLLLLQGEAPEDLAISARVLAADGSPAPGGDFKLLSREPAEAGIQRLLASFSPAGLAPGDYRLQVTLAGKGATKVVSEAEFGVGE